MRFLLIGRGRMGSLLEKTALSGGDTVVAALGGNVIVKVKEARIAISEEMARKIMI